MTVYGHAKSIGTRRSKLNHRTGARGSRRPAYPRRGLESLQLERTKPS